MAGIRRRRAHLPAVVRAAARNSRARVIASMRAQNDANRALLLVITGIVMAVLLIAIAAEAVGRQSRAVTKVLIIADARSRLAVQQHGLRAALCAHGLYPADAGCVGLEFPRHRPAGLLGLRLFRLHLRDGVRDLRREDHQTSACARSSPSIASPRSLSTSACWRSPSTCWASGHLGSNVDLRQRRRLAAARRSGSRRRSAPRRQACRATRAPGTRASPAPRPT